MKTILLLGGYGFLGTNIIKYIDAHLHLREQFRVIVFDKYDDHPRGITFQSVVNTYAGDFVDCAILKKVFEENKIDLVFHSLSTTIPVSSHNARYDVETNLLPTLDVLNLMVEYEVRDIVYMSSGGAVYGVCAGRVHSENDDVFPVSSYGVVKLAIEKYLMQYAQLFGVKPLIIRLSNPYGPYHYGMKQGVINVALAKALKGERMDVWGAGDGLKDYVYVEDFVDILFALLRLNVSSEVINIASGQLLSVNDIVGEVRTLVPSFVVRHVEADKFDASQFALDTTKLHQLIGDYKFCSIQDGMQKTYQWTKSII